MTYLAAKPKPSAMNHELIAGNVKMADLLIAEGRLLHMLPFFGIDMGFGEKTIEQICTEHGVSLPLFLMISNIYAFDDYIPNNAELKLIAIEDVVRYLQNAHRNYLESSMLQMLRNVSDLAELHVQPETKNMLDAFCGKYKQDVVAHIQYEEEVVFPYIDKLLSGEKPAYTLCELENSHNGIDTVLRDLRGLIIKYAPHTSTVRQCLPVLSELYIFERELYKHSRLENIVLVPLIERLRDGDNDSLDSADLSECERQTLAAIARGLSNKEIAYKLNISIHTVVSHRKNIVRKTGIKTVPGLTLYAYINNLVSSKDLR